jgi:hypothetical protein
VDADAKTRDASLTYHRSDDGSQVLLGIETDGVHCSIAFEAGTGRETIERLLDAQRRELEHYYETARTR